VGAATDPAGSPASSTTPEAVVDLVPPPGLLPWGTVSITASGTAGAASDGTAATTLSRVVVTSTGTVNGAQRTLEATVLLPTRPPGGSSAEGTVGQPQLISWRER
jgi:hypothetical protein